MSSWQALIVFHLQSVTLRNRSTCLPGASGFYTDVDLILLELFIVLLYKDDMTLTFFRVRKQDLRYNAQGT